MCALAVLCKVISSPKNKQEMALLHRQTGPEILSEVTEAPGGNLLSDDS